MQSDRALHASPDPNLTSPPQALEPLLTGLQLCRGLANDLPVKCEARLDFTRNLGGWDSAHGAKAMLSRYCEGVLMQGHDMPLNSPDFNVLLRRI
jgi:hypothetical protein